MYFLRHVLNITRILISFSFRIYTTGASMGIAGMLLQTHSGTGTDLADMLFKSAALTTSAPMSVTGDCGHQEYYSDLYKQQQAMCQE